MLCAARSTSREITITTAIVYPNARVHVGWAWECLGADWLARTRASLGDGTTLVTGMDEHSLNVQRAAEAQGLEPKTYCDRMAADIEKVLRGFGMRYDRFIRTSDEDHARVVDKLIRRAHASGDIYQGRYEGWYCESCEAYYTEKDITGGTCPTHGKPVRWLKEENWFFRLSKYEGALLDLFQKNPGFLEPEFRRNEVLNFVKAGLRDFSISRSTFTWGLPLPFEKGHVIYVWFDALINYLTASGVEAWLDDPTSPAGAAFLSRWPSTIHIVGKDITRFHCVYWPAMLMSLGIPMPARVFAHGFIQLKGEKISKSTGNLVTPDEVVAKTGMDPFRYYLLAENPFSQDGNFSMEALRLRCNADLANAWGNLANRVISMTRKYFPDEKIEPPANPDSVLKTVADSIGRLPDEIRRALEKIEPSDHVAASMARVRELNLLIDQVKPWALAKNPNDRDRLRAVLYTLLEGIRWVAVSLLPILPERMPEILAQLGESASQARLADLRWGSVSFTPGEPKPVYPRLEEDPASP